MFLQSLYFLPLIIIAIRMAVFSKCTLAPKVPKARHTESAVGSFFVHKLPIGNIPQSYEPCHSSLSYVFRVLWNSFSYPRDACITSSQTVLALFPKNIRALTVPFITVPEVLEVTDACVSHYLFYSKGYFQKIQHCQNHRQRTQKRRGTECESFF